MSFAQGYITANQGYSPESSNSSQSRTLKQVLQQKDMENPSFESGNRPLPDKTLYFSNWTGKDVDLFIYKGIVEWGNVLNTVPYHHATCQAFGGLDVIPVGNVFEVSISLYYQRQSNHLSGEVIAKPKRFPLSGYGTYNVIVSNRNVVDVQQTTPVQGQVDETFYFCFKDCDTNFDWKIQLFCDNQDTQTIKSTQYKDEEVQWVQNTQNLNDNFPTKKVIMKLPSPFTVFIVKESNLPLDMELLDSKDRKTWAAYGQKSLMIPGQVWLGTLENTQNNTCLVSILPVTDVMKVQPQSQKSPVTFNTAPTSY